MSSKKKEIKDVEGKWREVEGALELKLPTTVLYRPTTWLDSVPVEYNPGDSLRLTVVQYSTYSSESL